MSGLAVVRRRDGDVPRDRFEPVLSTMEYCGHDGRDSWYGDGLALGHQHHWTTPESVGQHQPVEVGGSHLAFAGRLDNRGELADALGVGASASDAELFGRAYGEWGPGCLERAVGAFGVALWDRRQRRLLLARDKTGIRSLFYAASGDVLVAGSDAAAVRSHPAVGRSVDETAFAAFLRDDPGSGDATFYEDVRRLPPGTRLIADDDGHRVERYWHPADGPDLRDAGEAELRGHLRAVLRKAIDARLRSRERPGVMLSGGLDSTTVAGVAAADLERRLPAYSMVFEAVDDEALTGVERRRLNDAAEVHDLPLEEVACDDAWPLSDPSAHDPMVGEWPLLDPLHEATDRLHGRIRDGGHRVVLTGEGGNEFDGTRFAYADLLRRGRLLALLRTARRDRLSTRWLLAWYALAPTFPSIAARLTDADDGPPLWLGPRLRGIEVPDHAAAGQFWSRHRQRRFRTRAAIRQALMFDVTRRRARRAGLELRTPFHDARVVELAFSIPPHALLAGGEPKSLFRSAFADVLPESVRSVQMGRHFGTFVKAGLERERDHLSARLSDTRLERRGYVADGAPADVLAEFLDGRDRWALVWRLYACERWLATLDGDPPD